MATYVKGKNANKPHTIRYFHDGRQREKSFGTKREAMDWKAKFEYESREQTFVDPKVAGEKFAAVAQRWLARHPGSPKTLVNYEAALRLHILPMFGHVSLAAVAQGREEVEAFLRVRLAEKGLGASMTRTCCMVINAIVNDAIKAGRIRESRLKGITLPVAGQKAEVVFATHEQIEQLAAGMPEGHGFSIYLMRGCGLRLGEALGVFSEDIRQDGVLRLKRQLAPDGRSYIPLKHRGKDDFRDIPVPQYVLDNEPGVFEILNGVPHVSHRTYRDRFNKARDAAGLPKSFTPHTLRHTFASVALAGGVPITDVSKWLGHRNIQTTFGIYGHLVPASWDRARAVLDAEWSADE